MDKVAIINSVYEYGSTGALAKELYNYGVNKGYEVFAFYGRGREVKGKHIIKIGSPMEVYIHKMLTLLFGYQGKYSNHATDSLLSTLRSEKIRKVILLNLHGYYLNERRLLNFLKENGIVTAYVTPDEYAGMGKCCYSYNCEKYKTECHNCPHVREYPKSLFWDKSNDIFNMKKTMYSGFNTMTVVGPEANLVKFQESTLLKNKPMKRVSWGIDLSNYRYAIDETLYDKYDIPKDKIIILTVANYSNPRKGVKQYFFEIARRLQNSKYHFINVGYDGNLRPEEIPSNMTTIGYVDDQNELAHLYSISDLYLLASISDTMPLSCLISFACETPVCCFYTSGLKYLADKNSPSIHYCETIEIDALEKIVRNIEKKDIEVRRACRKLAKDEYSVESFARKVYEVLEGR